MATLPPISPRDSSVQVDALQSALDDLSELDSRGIVFWDEVAGKLATDPKVTIDTNGGVTAELRPKQGPTLISNQIMLSATDGMSITGAAGTVNDLNIRNSNFISVMRVLKGTTGVIFSGQVDVTGGFTVAGGASFPGGITVAGGASFPSGNFLIGTSVDSGFGRLQVFKGTSTSNDIVAAFRSNFSSPDKINCRIWADGSVMNTLGTFGAISDIKLKENIVDCPDFLDKLMRVRIVNYNLKDDTGPDRLKLLGTLAQELEKIFPGLVGESPDYEMVPDPDWVPAKAIPEKTKEIEVEPARTGERQMTIKKTKKVTRPVIEFSKGKYYRTWATDILHSEEPIYDEYQVFDEYETPIEELLHRVPKMEAYTIPAVMRTATIAAVPAQTEADRPKIERLTGTTTKSVKYSVFVPMLIKSMQEMHAKLLGKRTIVQKIKALLGVG